MSIKDLFDKGELKLKVLKDPISEISRQAESEDFIREKIKRKENFIPQVDFNSASNFARFGLAEEYYEQSIKRVYQTYPYDGSRYEKEQWYNSSSYLDNFIFDSEYPRQTGYAIFSYDGWGTQIEDQYGYGAPVTASYEYITIKGGPNKDATNTSLKDMFPSNDGTANIYNVSNHRGSNLKIDGEKGNTVEFWLRKDNFSTDKTQKEVIFDSHTPNNISSSAGYGRFRIEMDGETSSDIAATATIVFGGSISGYDGETITIKSSDGTEVVYTLDDDTAHGSSTYTFNAVNIGIQGLGNRNQVTGKVVESINHADSPHKDKIIATSTDNTLTLTQAVKGAAGNTTITTTDSDITVTNFTGGTDERGPFLVTYMSGTQGTSNASLGYGGGVNINTIADDKWHHYAVSVANSGFNLGLKLYVDGEFVDEALTGSSVNYVSGAILGTIGALATKISSSANLSGAVPDIGWGKLSASMDEFRFWKTRRSAREVGSNWFQQVHGGTNTDLPNTDLGVYYKFNEGVSETASVDNIVLDYSGRASNGSWTGYSVNARSTGSAFNESFLSSSTGYVSEFRDPIIRTSNPKIDNILESLKSQGREHDFKNNSAIYYSMPEWITSEDSQSGYELRNLTQIIGNYFDTLALQVKSLPTLKNINYPSSSHKPIPFSERLLENQGLITPEIFADTDVMSHFLQQDETRKFDKDISDTKNLIYNNIYNNLSYIYKSKGTEKSFRNLIRCFGIDDELIKVNLYGDNVTYKLEDNYRHTVTKKNYVDFNHSDRQGAVVYQMTSSDNPTSVPFISGAAGMISGSAITLEAEAIFAKKIDIKSKSNFIYTSLTSSLFGFRSPVTDETLVDQHEVSGSTMTPSVEVGSHDELYDYDVKVYAVREEAGSPNVRFKLVSDKLGVILTSDKYYDVYDNEKWNFAVRFKQINPEHPLATGVSGSSHDPAINDDDLSGSVEFYGINVAQNYVQNSFFLSSSIGLGDYTDFVESPKRIYAGAERTNITGALVNTSDAKISSVRYWLDYVPDEIIKIHAIDPENFGREHPYRNAYLMQGVQAGTPKWKSNLSSSGHYIPQIETLALHWDFATVSGSDSDGRFIVQDLSSGSAGFSGSLSDSGEDAPSPGGSWPFDERYGTLGGILNRHHTGQGGLFPVNSSKVVDKVYLPSAKQLLPETIASSDMVQIINRDKRLFTRNTRPVNYFLGIEKSPYQAISEEILKMFGSIKDFDNLIGEPVNRYRPNYKHIEKLRQLFFEKIGNTPDLDKYVDYYKWVDLAVDQLIEQLIPISANASEQINTIVESHVLERNKYRTKFPSMDEKYGNREPDQAVDSPKNIPADDAGATAIEQEYNDRGDSRSDPEKHKFYHFNSTKFSTALTNYPISGGTQVHNKGILWWKFRAERDKVAEISSGDAEVDRQREIYRRVVTSNTAASSSAFNVAATAKPFTLSTRMEAPIEQGSNTSKNKSILFTKNTLQPKGDANIVLETTGSDNKNGNPDYGINPRKFVDDEPVPALRSNLKEKTNFAVKNNLTNEIIKSDIAAHFGIYSYSSSVKAVSREVTNIHDDSYVGRQTPMQGPFTERYVGGNQHRHTRINFQADDTVDTRPEGFRLYVKGDLTDGSDVSVKLCAADIDPEIKVDSNLPKATLYRDGLAKRPVNIANFKSGALGLGNYSKNYEVVQTSGRSINNKYFVEIDGAVSASVVNGDFSDLQDFALPERTRNETVIVEKFSAPGGPEVMSRGFLDTAAEEFSVYNALPFRNLSVRRPLMTLLSRSSGQFGVDSVLGSPSASFHKTHRNTSYRLKYGEDDTVTTASVNDNYFITRQIPQSDLQYSWITASVVAVTGGLEGVGFELLRATDSRSKIPFGYQKSDIAGNGASSDLVFVSSGSLGSYALSSNNYFGPDRLAQDDISGFIPVDFVGLNTLIHDPISSSINTLGELSPTVTDNSDYTYKGGVVNFLSNTYDGEERIFTALINHRQGSYGWPIWKQVRTGNHPIVRKQKRENIFNFYNTDYYTADLDKSHQNVIVYKDNKKLKQYRIPPVTSKFHPLTENINGVMNIKYSFGNNSSFTTIEDGRLDSKLGIEESFEPRVELDKNIKELMDNPNVQFNVGSTVYKETIWPKEEHTYLSGTRGRIQYAETGGYGSDGIDRVWGEQRTFWRDDPRDRNRTVTNLDGAHDNAAKNSMGFKMNESSSLWKGGGFDFDYHAKNPDQNPVAASVWPLDSNARGYPTGSTGELFSIIDKYFSIDHPSASHTMNASGDNEYGIEATASQTYFYYNWWGSLAAARAGEDIGEGNFTADGSEYSGTLEDSPYWLIRFARETANSQAAEHGLQFDSDGNYIGPTEEPFSNYTARKPYYHFRPQYSASALSGKTPWYDSYEDYSENIRPIAKDYGVIPEFKISEHMEYYLNTGFGKKNNKFLSLDGAAITSSANDEIEVPDSDFYKIYSHSDFLKHIDIIKEKNHGQEMSSITLTCKGVKKLLPYNGFYPVLRCVQLGSLFSASYMPNMTSSTSYDAPKAGMIQSLLQPFFAPGIMYNTIKSGIAVDWPAFTGSAAPVDGTYRSINTLNTGSDPTNPQYHNFRFPFEALVHPEKYIPRGSGSSAAEINPESKLSLVFNSSMANAQFFSGLADDHPSGAPDGKEQNAIWTGHHDIRYNLAMHNFLGEVPRFFLEDERLTTFASKRGPFTMMSGTTYYMDVVLDKNRDMIMYEGPNPTFKTALSSSADADEGEPEGSDIVPWESNGQGARGIHYGPGCSVREDLNSTNNSDVYDPSIEFRVSGSRDPAYAPYTPPYFYGESVARISFSPHKHRELLPVEGPQSFTIDEILEGAKIETIYEPNRSASYSTVDTVPGEETMAAVGKMKIDSSINLFGKSTVKEVEYGTDLGPNGKYVPVSIKDANAEDKSFDVWTISTKFETPVLNFSGNAEAMWTRGMWTGYGEVPKENDGITLSLRESFPQEIYKSRTAEAQTADTDVLQAQAPKTFGSLLQLCGFGTTNTKNKRKLGRLAKSKKISEAIVAIPFRASKGKNERRFFNIPRKEINKALGISKGETGVSVQQMVTSMQNYVFPPHQDFLTNKNVRPFAMYIFEFEHTLDRDDLRDIWQNLMPKIAMVPELDESIVHHPCGVKNEFFGEEGIPSDTKWMIFKVKRKAEKSYFNVTADSQDDSRFEFEFQVDSEKKSPDYSYNWPYDFFSLVELAKLETEI